MKKWLACLLIAILICCLGLIYFSNFAAQDSCLDAGGKWLGAVEGCEGGTGYSMQLLLAPLPIVIFFGIVLGISSALVQIHTMLSSFLKQFKSS